MTADQREQALAAVNGARRNYEGHFVLDDAAVDLVRAALTSAPLPADLAEIQARLSGAAQPGEEWNNEITMDRCWNVVSVVGVEEPDGQIAAFADDDVAEFVAHAPRDIRTLFARIEQQAAELAELRARPTLTADEVAEVVRMDYQLAAEFGTFEPTPLIARLRALDEGAGS